MITVLHHIQHYGDLRDKEVKGAEQVLRSYIERLKKQSEHLPWCFFAIPQRKYAFNHEA